MFAIALPPILLELKRCVGHWADGLSKALVSDEDGTDLNAAPARPPHPLAHQLVEAILLLVAERHVPADEAATFQPLQLLRQVPKLCNSRCLRKRAIRKPVATTPTLWARSRFGAHVTYRRDTMSTPCVHVHLARSRLVLKWH